MVRDVFRTRNMRALPGNVGIGPGALSDRRLAYSEDEAQPFYVNSPFGIVLGHNGNLTNAEALKAGAVRATDRRHINTELDTEVLLNVLAHELETRHGTLRRRSADDVSPRSAACTGASAARYAVVAMIAGYGVLAFRDPFGIRPLVLGSSETPSGTE